MDRMTEVWLGKRLAREGANVRAGDEGCRGLSRVVEGDEEVVNSCAESKGYQGYHLLQIRVVGG